MLLAMMVQDWGWTAVWILLHCTAVNCESDQLQHALAKIGCSVSTGQQCTNGDIRVPTIESSFRAGRISVCINQEWRAVCDTGWGIQEARVVCRQLGFTTQGTPCWSRHVESTIPSQVPTSVTIHALVKAKIEEFISLTALEMKPASHSVDSVL